MRLSTKFTDNIRKTFGQDGEHWLEILPIQINKAIYQWGLREVNPFHLSYNFVASAILPDDSAVVLKIGAPDPEFESEIRALEVFHGSGCARVLEIDLAERMFLMEKVTPGKDLTSIRSDRAQTEVACGVFTKIQHSLPAQSEDFIQLSDWFAGMELSRAEFGGRIPLSIPPEYHQKAQSLYKDLFRGSTKYALIHGDLHHFNILCGEEDWVAIDPKGVVGPVEYECGPFLMNPVPRFASSKNRCQVAQDRIAIMSEMLGYSRLAIRDWAFCHCVLSAWWDVDQSGQGGEYSIQAATIYHDLKV